MHPVNYAHDLINTPEHRRMHDYLIFDLDGTISDPKEGIVNSMNHALKRHGYGSRSSREIEKFIGPPLDQIFMELTGTKNTPAMQSLVRSYRERYADSGYCQNILYTGMETVLQELHKSGRVSLGLCTSKRVDFAERILDLFGLRHLFAFVNGGDVGIHKWQQLQGLLNDGIISDNSIMIGDRAVDLVAAHKNGLQSAGVLWGYGSVEELAAEKPAHIFSTPAQLLGFID